jgi:hypothetical protein
LASAPFEELRELRADFGFAFVDPCPLRVLCPAMLYLVVYPEGLRATRTA